MARGVRYCFNTLQAPGTAITAAARTSMTVGSTQARFTLPANLLQQAGDIVHLWASGKISSVITTPGTARFDLSVSGTAQFDTLAMPLNIVAQTNVNWELDVYGTVQTPGTAGTIMWQGHWLSPASILTAAPATGPGPGGQMVPYNTPPVVGAAFDMTVAQLLDLNFTQTVATGSCQVLQFFTELVNWTGF